LSRDFYSLFGGFTAAPPLEVSQGLDGVNYRLGPLSAGIDGIEVKEQDGSPDLFPITTLVFDQADGFAVSAPSAGVARIDFTWGGFEVKEADGAPDCTGVTVLLFDQATGFFVTQPVVGQAQIGVQDASATQKGVVNIVAQTFAGTKRFKDNATADVSFTALTFNLSSTQQFSTLELVPGSGTFNAGIYDGGVAAFGVTARLVLTNGGVGVYSSSGGAAYKVVDAGGTVKTGLYVGARGNGDVYSGGLLTTNGAAGFTGTAVLAKLTTTGAAGSLTFSNGWATAYVAPT
jgi:hypothetical protein